jgi:hypothetical protein
LCIAQSQGFNNGEDIKDKPGAKQFNLAKAQVSRSPHSLTTRHNNNKAQQQHLDGS